MNMFDIIDSFIVDTVFGSFDYDHIQFLFPKIMKLYSNILLMPTTSLSIHKMNDLHGLTQN
jgi:hypothetical protein